MPLHKNAKSLIEKIAAGEDYGYAPAVGTAAKILPIPFSGPLAAGITAGAEGEGRDTNESMSRGLHAGAGNLLGSILGSVGGALGGGALGVGSALIPAISRQRSWGGLGPKKWNFDPEIFAPAAATLGGIGAGAGSLAGNLYGGYKGTEAGIKHHRKAEGEREERAKKHYEGTKDKKNDDEKEAQLQLIQKLAGVKTALSPETVGAAMGKRMQQRPLGELSRNKGELYQNNMNKRPPSDQKKMRDAAYAVIDKKASSDMRSIIDDIIKGAEQNTFGRPVNIQTSWTHFDTAKFAGALQALGEQEYSVKEASEYLGLTEAQVFAILEAVR